MKNQRIIVVIAAAALLLISTIVPFEVALSFAQNVDDEGVEEDDDDVIKEDDDTTDIDNALARYKDTIVCALNRNSSDCEQESQAGIETEEEEEEEDKPIPTNMTCVECFTDLLSPSQITSILNSVDATSLAELCARFEGEVVLEARFTETLLDAGVSEEIAEELIECLEEAGIRFD
jgi:hypothetical protein